MALLYDLGIFSVVGTNAALGIGWTLTFYQSGTTTLRNTYPTEADAIALTNPNTNPVVIGADGRIPPIWLIDTEYKVVLKDNTGVVKMTRDPCMGSLASVTSGAALADNTVTNAKLTQIATARFKGRVTAGTGNVEDMTGTQATTLLDVFTSTVKGLAPASGGGTANFLRADGTWAAPGGGSGTVTSVALSAPAIFLVTGSPVVTTGTLALSLATQSANQVWAGPTSGVAATPAFRALVKADLPAPAIQSVISSATVTPTFADDQVIITAQAVALNLANPTGTAADGYGISIRIKDNGTARAITYGTQYRAIGVTLPSTTVISKTLYLGMIYNSADTKWDVVAVAQEA